MCIKRGKPPFINITRLNSQSLVSKALHFMRFGTNVDKNRLHNFWDWDFAALKDTEICTNCFLFENNEDLKLDHGGWSLFFLL